MIASGGQALTSRRRRSLSLGRRRAGGRRYRCCCCCLPATELHAAAAPETAAACPSIELAASSSFCGRAEAHGDRAISSGVAATGGRRASASAAASTAGERAWLPAGNFELVAFLFLYTGLGRLVYLRLSAGWGRGWGGGAAARGSGGVRTGGVVSYTRARARGCTPRAPAAAAGRGRGRVHGPRAGLRARAARGAELSFLFLFSLFSLEQAGWGFLYMEFSLSFLSLDVHARGNVHARGRSFARAGTYAPYMYTREVRLSLNYSLLFSTLSLSRFFLWNGMNNASAPEFSLSSGANALYRALRLPFACRTFSAGFCCGAFVQ